MGSPYQSQSASGYNSSPPPDDGSTVSTNKITWATIKSKITDPLKTLADAVNTALRTALNITPISTSINYTTLVGDHLTTIEVTGTTTISLGDAATMVAQAMGYEVAIVNRGVATVSVSRATGANTLNGAAKDIKLAPGQSVVCAVNSTSNGYNISASANGVLFDATDPSKQARVALSGLTAGVTRIATAPDNDFNLGLPRGYLAGLALSNNGGDPTNDINIAAGSARDSSDVGDIILGGGGLTKQLDAVWAVGSAAGGRASGAAIANTTYFVFVIRRPDTAVVDVAFDTSATGANITANTNAAYTQMRRIGAIVRSAGAILAFIQDGDKFVWTGGSVGDVSSTNPGTAAVTRTLTLPVGIRVEAILNASVSTASGTGAASLRLSDLSTTDVAASAATAQVSGTYSGAGNTIITNSECRVHTNTSAQVRSRIGLSDANVSVIIGTTGWVDRRGRDD